MAVYLERIPTTPAPGGAAGDVSHLPWLERDLAGGTISLVLVQRTLKRSGVRWTLSGRVRIEGADRATLQASVDAAEAALISGGGNVRVTMPLPASVGGRHTEIEYGPTLNFDGYPRGDCELLDDGVDGLTRLLQFTIESHPGGTGSGGGGADNDEVEEWTEDVETKPDGLVVATRSGSYTGANAEARYDAARDGWETSYPSTTHVYTTRVSHSESGEAVSFSLEARQLAAALPHETAVDGEVRRAIDLDHASGVTTTSIDVDLLIAGDPQVVYDTIKTANPGHLVRERQETTTHGEVRLRATLEFRSAEGGGDVVDWRQSIEDELVATVYEQLAYPGATPVLVAQADRYRSISQQGSAIGLTDYPAPAEPLGTNYLARPTVKRELVGSGSKPEYRTSWTYVFAVDDTFDATAVTLTLTSTESSDLEVV